MSTNKTPNYQLHNWLPEDEFHVAEINENFTKLDARLRQETEELKTALGQRMRMVTGSYTGTSTGPQHIDLGVCPKAVLIGFDRGFHNEVSSAFGGLTTPSYNLRGAVVLDATGFTVADISDGRVYPNAKGILYCYLAFY